MNLQENIYISTSHCRVNVILWLNKGTLVLIAYQIPRSLLKVKFCDNFEMNLRCSHLLSCTNVNPYVAMIHYTYDP